MAITSALSNAGIEYGSPTDVRMKITSDDSLVAPLGVVVGGGVVSPPKKTTTNIKTSRYRNKDKQAAYEKAIAKGIVWTGSYIKDAATGEVEPKTLEQLTDEKVNALDKSLVENVGVNPFKKYWWVLAAIGVYLIISND